eukprot:TRINITY_DN29443_c0_g1_i1.p2 TRINITY_DN29443_c0_g1~~TRINITY_DN29443_c0_g1_i1.p2  ORF type:complete len:280 (-),score=85.16 TRINITY_DN29443_c0_g1_i1:90-929(-)
MKRSRPLARLSISDEEDSSDADGTDEKRPVLTKPGAAPVPVPVKGPSGLPQRESEDAKAFAWMDSDDEQGGDEGDPDAPREDDAAEETAACEALAPGAIAAVGSLAEFLRLVPAVRAALPELSSSELLALCETSARLRFFDGELFGDVFGFLRTRVRSGAFDCSELTALVRALAALNALDRGVLAAAIDVLRPRVCELSKDQRLRWLDLLASVEGSAADAAAGSLVQALRFAELRPEDVPEMTAFEVCWDFEKGFCSRGANCPWKHNKKEKEKESDKKK